MMYPSIICCIISAIKTSKLSGQRGERPFIYTVISSDEITQIYGDFIGIELMAFLNELKGNVCHAVALTCVHGRTTDSSVG